MEDREISLKDIFLGVKKEIWKVFIFAGICGLLTLGYFMLGGSESFKSTGSLMVVGPKVNLQGANFNLTDPFYNSRLSSTYEQIVLSRSVCSQVEDKLGMEIPYDEFEDKVKVYALKNSEILGIDVVSKDANKAQNIAKAIFEIAPDKLKEILAVEEVRVLDQPNLPEVAEGGSQPVKAAKVALVAFVLGIFVCFLKVIFTHESKTNDKKGVRK